MIFLDTTYIIALINENDKYHKKALKLMEDVDYEKKMTNSVVFVESLNMLDKRSTQKDIDNIVNKFISIRQNTLCKFCKYQKLTKYI